MSFFQELQRRKVIRTVLAYGAAAFVAAQITQLLVDALGLSDWILKAVVVVAIVALPFVVGLAWAFDASKSGVQLTPDSTTPTAWAFPWRRLALPFAGSLVLLLAAFFYLRSSYSRPLNADLVAVLPFHISGDPQIAYLHEGMVDLLAAKLTGEGGPRAADPRGVMSVVRQAAAKDADLSDESAVRIARAVGTAQVLVGSVVGTPKQFTIHARLLRVPGGKLIVEAEQRGTADSLLFAVDQLVAKLLSLQAGEGPQRLEQLMTTSLPALRAYLDGKVAYRSGHFGRAGELFTKAIDTDSTFAVAAIGLFMTQGWGEGPPVDRAKPRRTVIANRSRLGKVDQAIAVAMYGESPEIGRTVKQRLNDWDKVVALAPDHLDARFWYADVLFHWGAVTDLDNATEDADEAFSQILREDSTYFPALLHRIDAAMRLDRVDLMRAYELQRKRLDPHGTAAGYQRAKRIRVLGDSAAIAAERAALDTMDADGLESVANGAGSAPGSVADAVAAIELGLKRATTTRARIDARWAALDRYYMFGMPSRANTIAKELTELGAKEAVFMPLLTALYWDGDQQAGAEGAAAIDAALRDAPNIRVRMLGTCVLEHGRLWQNDTSAYKDTQRYLASIPDDNRNVKILANVCAETIATIRSTVLRSPDLPARVQALNAVLRDGPPGPHFILNISNIVLGRAAEQAGDLKLAQRAYARRPVGALESQEFTLPMMREEARLAARNGDPQRAARLYRRYLLMHEQADPSLKPVDDAVRRELARIAAEPRN